MGWDPPDDTEINDGYVLDSLFEGMNSASPPLIFHLAKTSHDVLATTAHPQRRSITKLGQFIMDGAAGISVANETSWIPKTSAVMRLPPGAASLSGVGGDKTTVTAVRAMFEPLGHMTVNHAVGSVANIASVPDIKRSFSSTTAVKNLLKIVWRSLRIRQART